MSYGAQLPPCNIEPPPLSPATRCPFGGTASRNSSRVSAGVTAAQAKAATKSANSNTHVASATKVTRQPPATGIKNKPVLPTPVNAKVPHTYLAGYNPTLKRFLIDGFIHGFRISSEDPVYMVNIPGNHGSALSQPAKLSAK